MINLTKKIIFVCVSVMLNLSSTAQKVNKPIRSFMLSLVVIAITFATGVGSSNTTFAATSTASKILPSIVFLLLEGDPLIVESHIPQANETEVSRGIEVRIQFNSPLNDTTVNTNNIAIIGPLGVEPSQLSHSDGLLVITPDNILDLSSVYSIELQLGLRNTSGDRLAEIFSFSFTTTAFNSPPVARQVTISDENGGDARVGDMLNGEYQFFDVDFDNEGASQYQWFRNDQPIASTNSTSYVLTVADNGVAVRFQVQPIALTGALTGDTVQSDVLQTITLPAPVAFNDDAGTDEDVAISFSATNNDQDADNNIDTASIDLNLVSSGIQSTFTDLNNNLWEASAAGEITFTPELNITGVQSTQYTVRDLDGLESNAATLTVTVNPINDPPFAVDDDVSTDEDVAFSFNATNNDLDPENNIDTASIDLNLVSGGIQSTFTDLNNNLWQASAAGEITFTPELNINGVQSTQYTVRDLDGLESNAATLTVTVNPINDPPEATEDFASTSEIQSTQFNITQNDSDVDGNLNVSTVDLNLSVAGIQQNFTSVNGDLWSVDAVGNLTFSPVAPGSAPRSINYVVSDTDGAVSNMALVTITITEDPPVVDTIFRSCAHALESGQIANGAYLISADGIEEAHSVFCDQSVDGGGWTLVGSTQVSTLNDESSEYYNDLARLAPNAAHTGIWNGLRSLGSRWDVRFACRASVEAADQSMDVDLSFYDVNWYEEFTTGTDADSCFSETNGFGADSPVPARRDNISSNFRRKTDRYNAGFLEGEDVCGDTGDFTVDLDDRGMDRAAIDGTDWGEDDSVKLCGASGLASGQWFVFARERPRVAVVGLNASVTNVLRDENILTEMLEYNADLPAKITTENFDTVVIGRYASLWSRMTQELIEALTVFGRNGGNIVTEWEGASLFMSSYMSNYRYLNGAANQIDWFDGRIGAGGLRGRNTPMTQLDPTDPIFDGVANPILGEGSAEFFFTIEDTFPGFLGTGHETLATFPGNGTTAFPNDTYPAITRGRYCGGQFISANFDWSDNPNEPGFGPLIANLVKNASTPSPADLADACPVQVRPNFAVCGSSSRDPADIGATGVRVNTCVPNDTMQVMYVTRTGAASITGSQLQSYLGNGGIIITEYTSSDDVYNGVFGGSVVEGPQLGVCRDNVMPVVQAGGENGFWQENLFEPPSNGSGCGKDMSAYPSITRLGGWTDTTTQLAYRDFGLGRVWLVEADWQDSGNDMSEQSKGLMRYMANHSGGGLYGRGMLRAGVSNNQPIDRLLSQNFQVCLKTPYNSTLSLADIQAACTGSTLAMACRETDSGTLQVMAMGDRNEVFEDTGESDIPNPHNGVGWYYAASESWGFAPGGEAINRASCDTLNPGSNDRLCWHTGATTLNSGWRCGSDTGLFDSTFERIVLQRDGDVPSP